MVTEVLIRIDDALILSGHLTRPESPKGWIIFVHGSGSSRFSPRNNHVSRLLNEDGYGTLLFDLLTPEEDMNRKNRFDIGLLAWRTQKVTEWFLRSDFFHGEPLAYFGASTGAAAALVAASTETHPCPVFTVISRGGRPDLAGVERLRKIHVPVLLIVGSLDQEVVHLNKLATQELPDSRLLLIRGATHLFEEPGTLDEVIRHSVTWLDAHLPHPVQRSSHA